MSSGGPLMFMNMRAAVVFMSSDALVGVMIKFISLKPRSQSALLAGSVCKQRNSGFRSFGIFLPPLSLKSRKLCLTGVTGSLNLVHKSSI